MRGRAKCAAPPCARRPAARAVTRPAPPRPGGGRGAAGLPAAPGGRRAASGDGRAGRGRDLLDSADASIRATLIPETSMTVETMPIATLHPARAGARPMTAEDLWALPRVGAPEPSPDGCFVVLPVTRWEVERNESRTQLWRVPLADGEPEAITAPEQSAGDPRLSPDGRRLAFTRKDGNGKAQLMLIPLAGGEARKLTDLPLGVFDPQWLPDGSGLVFVAPVLNGHFTPAATAAELKRRADDPVKAHVTEERFY